MDGKDGIGTDGQLAGMWRSQQFSRDVEADQIGTCSNYSESYGTFDDSRSKLFDTLISCRFCDRIWVKVARGWDLQSFSLWCFNSHFCAAWGAVFIWCERPPHSISKNGQKRVALWWKDTRTWGLIWLAKDGWPIAGCERWLGISPVSASF